MKWIAVVVLICGFSGAGFSQGYLVLNTGDTLRGKIKFMTYDQIDRVQVTDQKKKTLLTAREVRTVFYDNGFYRPLQFDNMIRFMVVEKSGYLSLLMIREGIQISSGGRYLVKGDGRMMEVPNLTFKKNMAEFLSDSPEVQEKIKAGTYTKRDLNTIIDEYNATIGSTTVVKAAERANTQIANEKVVPLQKLRKSVEALATLNSKKDALDLIDDIIAKVKANQNVPNYLLEGLQKYLDGVESTKEDLESVMRTLK